MEDSKNNEPEKTRAEAENERLQDVVRRYTSPAPGVKVLDSFTDSMVAWVDKYLSHQPMKPLYKPSPLARVMPLILIVLGAVGQYSWQHIHGDTYQHGYEAREIEQFEHTQTETLLRVEAVAGQRVEFQPINPDGSTSGKIRVHKICPGFAVRWVPGEVLTQFTYEERPRGDGGTGCENVNYPQLGFTTWRNQQTLESVNLFAKAR